MIHFEDKQEIFNRQVNEEAMKEKVKMHAEYPPVWDSNCNKTGKIVVIFDRAQQERNKHYKFNRNKTELLLIYCAVKDKSMNTWEVWAVNMKQLLDNEELLTFGFDDYNFNREVSRASASNMIVVQAKNLYLY